MISVSNAIEVMPYELALLEGLNSGDISAADKAFHPNVIIHINGGPKKDLSLQEYKQMVGGMLPAFPDLKFTIEEQIVTGNKVCLRWEATGTHTAPLGDMPPTNKQVKLDGLIIDYLKNGKVAERWELWDQMAMLQQLGAM